MASDPARNRQTADRLYAALYRRDFDGVGALFADDGHYTDVATAGPGAYGPRQIAQRLRIGLEPLEAIYHHPRHMAAEGDLVIVEHAEEWHWGPGESVVLPFVSVLEFRDDGLIVRWHDYWDTPTLMNAAPKWWLEHVMKHAGTLDEA